MKDIIISIIGNDPSILTLFIKIILCIFLIILAVIAKKIDTKMSINIYDEVMKQIEYIIKSIVVYMNQTVVDEWKENGNGKLSEEQVEWINERVISLIKKSLNSEQVKILEELYPDIETAIQIIVEKHVNANKSYFPKSIVDSYNSEASLDEIIENAVKSVEEVEIKSEETPEEVVEEKPKKKRTRKTTKKEESKEDVKDE